MRKIKVMIVLLITLAAFSPREDSSPGSTAGIVFQEGSWSEILELAKRENKYIFLDIYASWCGPCRAMKLKTFTNEKVGNFYNENFINVGIDAEKGEGKQLANLFDIEAFPTLIFLDPNGNTISKAIGYHQPAQLIRLGKEVIEK